MIPRRLKQQGREELPMRREKGNGVFWRLPSGYEEIAVWDLLRNRKQFLAVNGLSLLIVVIMVIWGLFLHPVHFSFADGAWLRFFCKAAVFLIAAVVYMALHEWVHGLLIRLFSGRPARYGVGFGYAYAASDAYFDRRHYLSIALAPVIIWGVVLCLLIGVCPSWFWVLYGVQILNLSGAAGDYFVTVSMLRLPAGSLVRDSGTSMRVYAPAALCQALEKNGKIAE